MIHTTRIRSGCKGSVFNGSYHEDPVRLEEKNIIFLPDSPETSQKSPLYLMDPGTKRNAHKTDPSYDEGEERCFPARFLVVFLSDSPKPFQRSPSYYPDPGTKHETHDNGDFSVHNLSKLKLQPEPAYYLIQTQPIHEWLHENLHQKNAS